MCQAVADSCRQRLCVSVPAWSACGVRTSGFWSHPLWLCCEIMPGTLQNSHPQVLPPEGTALELTERNCREGLPEMRGTVLHTALPNPSGRSQGSDIHISMADDVMSVAYLT